MISRYGIFCKVLEMGSFTKVAEELGYSQSAISQTIKGLEQDIGVTLIDRRKDGILLTADGEQLFPYLQSVNSAEKALEQKQKEMKGLENSIIRIGTFTSVSRNILPPLMKAFKDHYPGVTFILRQGEYNSIASWIKEGSIDFGFVNSDVITDIETRFLYEDKMLAVLPADHKLAKKQILSLKDLSKEPFILLDEGESSVPLKEFEKNKLSPQIAYEVYDDYTILAMVRQGLGISIMYEKVVTGFEHDLVVRPIKENPKRTVALAWQRWDTLSYASRNFAEYIIEAAKFSIAARIVACYNLLYR